MADFLDEKVKEIDARLTELKPLVDEYARLNAAREALSGVPGSVAAAPKASRGRKAGQSGRKGAAAAPRKAGSGRRRARRGGTRANQALELVKGKPGITIPELAEAMSIQPNYLYRVLPGLADEGHIKREGRGWHPA